MEPLSKLGLPLDRLGPVFAKKLLSDQGQVDIFEAGIGEREQAPPNRVTHD